MTPALERLAPDITAISKKKGFLASHPYVAAAVAAIMCLCIGQKFQSERGFVSENAALLVYNRYALGLAFAAIALFWAMDIIKCFEKNRIKAVVYACGFLGAEVLLWRLFAIDDVMLYALPLLPMLMLLADWFIYKKPSGVSSSCLGLACLTAFGFNIWTLCLCAAIASCFMWFYGAGQSLWKRCVSILCPLCGAAGAYYMYNSAGEDRVQILLVSAMIILIAAAISVQIYKGLSLEQLIFVLFAAGFVLRLCYVLGIAGTQNQHDVWQITNLKAPKHNLYIRYIYENGALPQTAENLKDGLSQYYHPPLHHALAALWMRIQTAIGIDFYLAYENVQYLTLFYSTAIMVAAKKLFEEFGLKKTGLALACAVMAFHPTFYILAGSVNNDVLCVLLFVLSMLYSMRFFKKQSVGNTVALALCIGLGMMAKLNVALVAIGTGMLFIYMLFCKANGGFALSFKRLWKRFALFGAICVPLGLWWTVYTKLRFDLPIGYVPSMSATPSNSQFVGNYGVLSRLFGLDALRIGNIYPNIGLAGINGEAGVKFYDYGILPYSVKSSLFGEYFYKHGVSDVQNIVGYVLMFATLAIIFLALFAMGKRFLVTFLKGGKASTGEYGVGYQYLTVCFVVLLFSYILFCFSYPFTCTMDFRYIVPVVPIAAVFLGKLVESDDFIKNGKVRSAVKAFAITAVSAFAISSALFYSF